MVRAYPNIVITGTPGTGKTSHGSLLASTWRPAEGASNAALNESNGAEHSSDSTDTPLRHINVGDLCKEHDFTTSFDSEWQSYQVDEDALLDYLEPLTGQRAPEPAGDDAQGDSSASATDVEEAKQSADGEERGGLVLDWHTCDLWPERWVDLVVVLRCDHELLWKRLEKRSYPLAKIQENNDAEIMEVVLSDARESYPEEAIVELKSEKAEDVEENVDRIKAWIDAWRRQRGLV